ncbi:hypothetical protein [Thermoactinospora rubra]|uniref:hypothetical protein n=1 Tax=Thermoactinospora rubra TaxID=1088767 RepID=UPI00117D14E5|nr:hypothetical protein [Thermoactinospora rubra]
MTIFQLGRYRRQPVRRGLSLPGGPGGGPAGPEGPDGPEGPAAPAARRPRCAVRDWARRDRGGAGGWGWGWVRGWVPG